MNNSTPMSNICSEQPGMKTYISGALAWILLICTILYLNVCTPPLSDDWAYNCGEWKNIIPDTWNEYFAWNPRVTGTMFTRIFALLPNGIVDVINTLMVPLMFMYVVRIAIGNNWKQAFSHWLTPCILWGYTLFMLIYPGQVLFWHCGVASYYFPMVLGIMLVDAFVDSLKKGEIWNPSLPRLAGWCLIAVLGSMGTFNLAGAIFLLGCFLMVYLHFQQGGCIWKMPIHQWKLSLILILIVLCQVLVVISPANDIRMQCTPPEEIGNIFNGGFYRQTRDFITNVFSYKVFRTGLLHHSTIHHMDTARCLHGVWLCCLIYHRAGLAVSLTGANLRTCVCTPVCLYVDCRIQNRVSCVFHEKLLHSLGNTCIHYFMVVTYTTCRITSD